MDSAYPRQQFVSDGADCIASMNAIVTRCVALSFQQIQRFGRKVCINGSRSPFNSSWPTFINLVCRDFE